MSGTTRPITLALVALGGQGGGVVTGWLAQVARGEGFLVQATSVPGVAQRTGATLYYLEFFPAKDLPPDGRRPVMALMPNPGDVDVVVATELVEAGRALQRGLITPDRTTLITSTHRVYTISEKSHLGDGRIDPDAILRETARASRRLISLDMAELADRHGAIISAVVLGAIAGGAGLPFAAESYRQAIREGGSAVATNMAAFDASLERTRTGSGAPGATCGMDSSRPPPTGAEEASPAALLAEIRQRFFEAAWPTLGHGVARLVDYQDVAYAREYLDRLTTIAALEPAGRRDGRLTCAVARGLALWMSYEDTMRVAQLKTRATRGEAIRRAAGARPGQVVEIREFLKPRVEEICGTLPERLGRRMLGSPSWRRRLGRFAGARTVRTTSVSGFLLLRAVAALRRFRRGTLRHALERTQIDAWLAALAEIARVDYELALQLAECQRLVRGYGETHERGLGSFQRILASARTLAGREGAAPKLAGLLAAAQVDDRGEALGRELAILGKAG